MAEPLKVTVTLTITIEDPDEWTTTYGVQGRAKIRQDVKEYVGNGIQQSGAFGSGEITATIDWK